MTDATPGMVEMARRIADETIPEDSDAYDTHEARMSDWYVARDAALTAIIETQRLCAELVEWMGDDDPRFAERAATAIRAGQHYGKDPDQ